MTSNPRRKIEKSNKEMSRLKRTVKRNRAAKMKNPLYSASTLHSLKTTNQRSGAQLRSI